MSRAVLTRTYPWSRYSKKLTTRILEPHSMGSFENAGQMRLVTSDIGNVVDGNAVRFFWLVDPEDGMITDAKFQAFGQSALLGASEAACEIVIHKYYDQASRISADFIDKYLRDKPEIAAFPEETAPLLNLVVDLIEKMSSLCTDIPLPIDYVSPVPSEITGDGYPGWLELNTTQKIAVIEDVIKQDIRPYIELDGGGVQVINLLENEVVISYQGSCTSCFSSTGATLSYIQQILRAKVFAGLVVIPSFDP